MSTIQKTAFIALFSFLLIFSEYAQAHIKWFVAFDVSDPPKSLQFWISQGYVVSLIFLSLWGVIIACLIDSFWCRHFGRFTYINRLFSQYDDIALNIARIGTGIFFVILWIVGGIILTPDLATDAHFIPYIQLFIAISVLFRSALWITGIGILFLYGYSVDQYGIFHLLDYLTLVGLGLFFILSAFKNSKLAEYRFPFLYGLLIFSFLWSAVEKLAYPQWFYPFLEKYPFLTMGLDNDLFIACAAFVEFTLFFLLLMGSNGVVVVALLSNIVITSGNIYFGKIDAIGHFPVNFILLIMLINGPLPIKHWFFDHRCKPYSAAIQIAMIFLINMVLLFSLYYGLHWILFGR
ncbi:MAG: hypothetical protein KAG28_06715 [Cocleimonas sp.]|nr:hypothetical protein [Cocleimonas sp.]